MHTLVMRCCIARRLVCKCFGAYLDWKTFGQSLPWAEVKWSAPWFCQPTGCSIHWQRIQIPVFFCSFLQVRRASSWDVLFFFPDLYRDLHHLYFVRIFFLARGLLSSYTVFPALFGGHPRCHCFISFPFVLFTCSV